VSARVLEGRTLAREIESQVAEEARSLREAGILPCLAVVVVGSDPASAVYVAGKGKACKRVGVISRTVALPESASQDELASTIGRLNHDSEVCGILVQLPLPPALDPLSAACEIDPAKDVDGLTPENLGRLLLGLPYTVPCTPAGIVALLDRWSIPVEGANVAIVGRSNIVGKPLAAMLMQKAKGRNATVTVCHSGTREIARFTRAADLVVTAMGSPRYLKADMVREGCVVVDVGMNRLPDPNSEKGYTLVGDADFEQLVGKVGAITPVPGGVGPLTVAMLLRNTIKVARAQRCRP
jgi:methylenetetrahydrofolate dehydrogenase (NADP+)/methenyltetrahydrofolate cyclohydrolase